MNQTDPFRTQLIKSRLHPFLSKQFLGHPPTWAHCHSVTNNTKPCLQNVAAYAAHLHFNHPLQSPALETLKCNIYYTLPHQVSLLHVSVQHMQLTNNFRSILLPTIIATRKNILIKTKKISKNHKTCLNKSKKEKKNLSAADEEMGLQEMPDRLFRWRSSSAPTAATPPRAAFAMCVPTSPDRKSNSISAYSHPKSIEVTPIVRSIDRSIPPKTLKP